MTEDGVQFDGVQREYDWEDTTVTLAVLESIAVLEYGNPNLTKDVLDEPLDNYLNADALEQIARSSVPVTVEFTISGYHVQVSENQVSVKSADQN